MTATPHQSGLPSFSGSSDVAGSRARKSSKHRRWKVFPPQPKSVRVWQVQPASPDEPAGLGPGSSSWVQSFSGSRWLIVAVLLGVGLCLAVLGGWLSVANYLGE